MLIAIIFRPNSVKTELADDGRPATNLNPPGRLLRSARRPLGRRTGPNGRELAVYGWFVHRSKTPQKGLGRPLRSSSSTECWRLRVADFPVEFSPNPAKKSCAHVRPTADRHQPAPLPDDRCSLPSPAAAGQGQTGCEADNVECVFVRVCVSEGGRWVHPDADRRRRCSLAAPR